MVGFAKGLVAATASPVTLAGILKIAVDGELHSCEIALNGYVVPLIQTG